MDLNVKRTIKTDKSSIGDFYINGEKECLSLEDKDRFLKQTDSIEHIRQNKIVGVTAIPTGRYEVILNFSNRFQKFLPLLLNVPGYEGVRIHPGNKAEDTEGCILLGQPSGANDFIGSSQATFAKFMTKFKAAADKEKIFITIE